MINEEKVKIMDRLAVYEKQEGRKYLPVSKSTGVTILVWR